MLVCFESLFAAGVVDYYHCFRLFVFYVITLESTTPAGKCSFVYV